MERIAKFTNWVLFTVLALINLSSAFLGIRVPIITIMHMVVFNLALWGFLENADRVVVRSVLVLNATWGLLTAALGIVNFLQQAHARPAISAGVAVLFVAACLLNCAALWRRLTKLTRRPRSSQ
ncbi:hypothetical protein [Hydrogenophaga intermedia]|uniref:hypothetical protein n=1 Tax=Hydrogenophaga intermedia TaxID=65786 RepID=UPI000558DA34|nr:hypothetical protein [Hydrogenophaga intermedia]